MNGMSLAATRTYFFRNIHLSPKFFEFFSHLVNTVLLVHLLLAIHFTDDYCSTKVFILCTGSNLNASQTNLTVAISNETDVHGCGATLGRAGGGSVYWSGQTLVLVTLGVVTNSICGWIVYEYMKRKSSSILQHIKQNSGLPPLPKAKDLLSLSRAILMILGGTTALLPFSYIELVLDLNNSPVSNSVLILLFFTPMALVMCFLVPVLIMSVANDSDKFVRSVLLRLICISEE